MSTACGDHPVVVTPQRMGGRAYGLAGQFGGASGAVTANVPPTPDTGRVATTSTTGTPRPCVAAIDRHVSARALCASVSTFAHAPQSTEFPAQATATSSVEEARFTVAGVPVTARTVQSTADTMCWGSTGSATIGYLAVGASVLIDSEVQAPPNTVHAVAGLRIVLNEQTVIAGPELGLRVNGLHVSAPSLASTATDIVLASSESTLGNCP